MKPAQGKTCPSCGERYEPAVLFCPLDGSPLSSGRAVRDPSFSEVDPYLGLELQGNIRLSSLVGVGSMGRVYRAFQSGVDRDVAVKVLHRELARNRELVARFHREAKIASRLVHPNVVQVLMTGALEPIAETAVGGELYLVMEYLDGISLMSALAAAGASEGDALPLARALHIVLQLCAAVGEAHAQGVVHRDLKPENIMLVRRGDDVDFVKVLDFGIARQDFAEPGSTQAGLIFGTARYISPEGAEGHRVTPPADVYSIATIFYQCLAGCTPFEGDSPMALLMQQIQTPAPDLRDIERASYVPDPIAEVIMSNLAKDPEARAEDARALRKDLLTAARASGFALESLMGQASLKMDSKLRTRAHNLGEDVSRALKSMKPEPRASRPSLTASDVERLPRSAPPSAPPSSRYSSAPPPRASRPTGPPAPWTENEAAPPSDDTLHGMSKVPGEEILARAQPHRTGPTVPGVPLSPAEREITERGERSAGEQESDPGPTMQGHSVPRSVSPTSADLAFGARRRTRVSVIAMVGFALVAVPALALGAMHFLSPTGTADGRAREQLYGASEDALANRAWISPPGANIKELTDQALSRYPSDPRFRVVRQEAAAMIVADALGRKYEGAPTDALRLARLAAELDPSLIAADKLAEELAPLAESVTPGPALGGDPSLPPSRPPDIRSQRVPRVTDPRGAPPGASAAVGPKVPPGASAAVLPPPPPPLSDDTPQPPTSARPWL